MTPGYLYKRYLLPLLAVLHVLTFFSQDNDIQFEHLSMKDGLSMNPVMAITQDRSGFLWFGTQDGLNKYDGYSFTVFKSNEADSSSISDNFITSVCLDKDSNLWIGTLNGLNVYDHRLRHFSRFDKTSANLKSTAIYYLYTDKQGMIWLGTSAGLALFDPSKKQFLNIKDQHTGLSTMSQKAVLSIFQDHNGTYWFGTSSGLVRYIPSRSEMLNYYNEPADPKSLSNNVILSFYEDSQKNLWIGTLNGLNRYDGTRDVFFRTYFKEEKGETNDSKKNNSVKGGNIYSIVNNYGGNTIRCILEDPKGDFWIGTDMELIIYNPASGKFLNYKKDLINPTGINDHFIRSMYVDRSRNLWIGTLGNGINKTNLKPKKFRHYQKKINNEFSLSENYVRSICEDNRGNIWVGTLVGGLNRFEKSSSKFYHYKKTAAQSPNSINDDNAWSLAFDKKRNGLWIGTNNGLDFLDFASGQFSHYMHNENDAGSISDNTVRYVFVDDKDRVWCGTENGFNVFVDETKTFKSYTAVNSKLSDLTVWCIKQDKKGKLWLATNNGLNVFDPQTGEFKVYKKTAGKTNSLSHNGIRTLMFDSNGFLWVGTQNGLNKMDIETEEFTRYSEKDGLPNPFIYGIVQDNYGSIWLSTNKGISCLDKKTDTFRNYDIYDGLQDYEFNTNACFISNTGEIYFGGPNGFNVFTPANLSVNNYNPPVELTDIKLKNQSLHPSLYQSGKLELGYRENILSFEFSSLDFTSPGRNRYMYKLEGFNDDWVDAGHIRFCTYTNLDPGNYTLLIRGSNVDGVWSSSIASVKVTITPPFWKTTWFYVISIAGLLLGIIVFIKLRTRSLIRSKEILEQTVLDRTRIIELQKTELMLKNKDITDSINYARRIQTAVLPEEQQFKECFDDAFVLYLPRDIVSGDMYWLAQVTTSTGSKLKLKVAAVVDCTGHGVPGAFMSLIVSELLNQSIKNPAINSPSDLLNHLAKGLPQALSKNTSEKIADGIDIAVCAIDLNSLKVYFSGANRPLWLVRKGASELEEIKPAKTSIGGYFEERTAFETYAIQVNKGDQIYLCSDGYADQFGGAKGKKLGSSNFKNLITKISGLSHSEQKEELKKFMLNWRGDKEQIDDICVLGIRI